MLTVDIVRNIIESMTPTFRVKSIEDVTATQWKLNTCNTYWLRACREIEIDGSVYIIDAVTHNEHITISPIDGALKPVITEFSIYAPSFYFGTRNKVNTDRTTDGNLDDDKGFDAITPFAFLLSRISETDTNDDENPVERNATIKLFFLEEYDLEDDTHNKSLFDSVIKQLHSMADYFIKAVSDDESSFNEPENIERRTYEAFSNDNTNSEWYLDTSLAGVELNLTLPILRSYSCDSCSAPSPVPVCAPVIVDINSVNFDTYLTGTQNNIVIKDQEGNVLNGVKSGNEYIINIDMVQGEQRTGNNLVFDNFIGAFYNVNTPSNSATITLDETAPIIGGICAFYNDGTVEPTVTPTPTVRAGTYHAGQVNIYMFVYDGTDFIQNIVNMGALEQLETPTTILTAINEGFDYDLSDIDPNATGGEFTYSDDNITFIPVPSWTFGDVNGSVTGLVNGTQYYTNFEVTALGYVDSDISAETVTPADTSTIIFQDDFAGTTLDPLKWNLTGGVSDGVVITQNDQLNIDVDGSQNQNVGANDIRSVDLFDLSMTRAFSFDISSEHQDNDVGLFVGTVNPTNGADNQISLFYGASGVDSLRYWVKDGGTQIIPLDTLTIDLTTVKTFKILVTPTTTSLHYWNGASWTQFATVAHTWSQTQLLNFGSGNKAGEPVSLTTVDNVYVTNADFATQYPI